MISIIIPVYNSEKFINHTIESCINQTHKDIEILIVDDCSTDNSVSIIVKYLKQDSRIKLFKNTKNMGVIRTINYGLKQSKGEYVVCLGHDDVLDVNHISTALKYLYDGDYCFAYFSSNLINEKGDVIGENIVNDIDNDYYEFTKNNPINACGLLINMKYLKLVGLYPEFLGFRNYGEWYLWIELLQLARCKYIDVIRSNYRIHSDNLTKKLIHKDNILNTKKYNLICMKKAMSICHITYIRRIQCFIYRILYSTKMNVKYICCCVAQFTNKKKR